MLLGDTDRSHYPVIPGELNDLFTGEPRVYGAWEGNAVPMCQALIFAEHARDCTWTMCAASPSKTSPWRARRGSRLWRIITNPWKWSEALCIRKLTLIFTG